jgi:Skp family chaperone for outer membrane proteins
MNRVAVLALILAASTFSASAGPIVAVVRVREIYAALPATEDLQNQVKQERDAILRDPRAEELRRIIAELQTLQTRLSDKKNPPDDATALKLARQYELTRQEAQTLQRDFESFRAEREKDINRRMVAGMRASLGLIHETARKVAAEQGCDLVLDNSGNTNTGVPFLLYQKSPPDLTTAVIAALEKNAAASASPTPPNP